MNISEMNASAKSYDTSKNRSEFETDSSEDTLRLFHSYVHLF